MHKFFWTILMVLAGMLASLAIAMQTPELAAGSAPAENHQERANDRKQANQEKESPPKLPMDQDSIARRDYMRVKLMFTQNIIEGLTMKNFGTILQAGEEIRNVTQGAAWNAVDSDEYRFQSREFQRSVDSLIRAADSGNIDATTMRFFGMTTKCVDCHEHLRMRADF